MARAHRFDTELRANSALRIDADFPGGNIVTDEIAGDRIVLRPDRRDSAQSWFYWYFRVRGAAGRCLDFKFSDGDAIGPRGPAVSRDGARTWAWCDAAVMSADSFRHSFGADEDDIRFCVSIPYMGSDLAMLENRHAAHRALRHRRLCRSEQGAVVEAISVGCIDREPSCRVLLTCRHHACESPANFVLEGILDAVLSPDELGRWLQSNVEILALPFMDKDGVENGDQGKFREPHDHYQDYGAESLYASVRALRDFVPHWSAGRPAIALDLHSPWLRGGRNETLFFVEGSDPARSQNIRRYSRIVSEVQTGPLRHDPKNNLEYGCEWNTEKMSDTFIDWAQSLPGIAFASALEIPYAEVSGVAVDTESLCDRASRSEPVSSIEK